MSKTIKEMASEYGRVNYIVRYTADGDKEIDTDTGAEFFEDGANYVLEEIKKAVSAEEYYKNDSISCTYTEFVKDRLLSKIKELMEDK